VTERQWKDWPEECPECGGNLEVCSEDRRAAWAFDGDPVRCSTQFCGITGFISCDIEADEPYALFETD
jgi:hypothetical protein